MFKKKNIPEDLVEMGEEEYEEQEKFVSHLTDMPCPHCGNLLFFQPIRIFWKHTILTSGIVCGDCSFFAYDLELVEEYKKQFEKSGGVIRSVVKPRKNFL